MLILLYANIQTFKVITIDALYLPMPKGRGFTVFIVNASMLSAAFRTAFFVRPQHGRTKNKPPDYPISGGLLT